MSTTTDNYSSSFSSVSTESTASVPSSIVPSSSPETSTGNGPSTTSSSASSTSYDNLPSTLSWEDVRHPDFPAPGSTVDYEQWILDHADPSLLWNGILDIPILSDEGAAKLAAMTQRSLDDVKSTRMGVGSMHSYGTDLFPQHTALIDAMIGQLEPIIDLVFLSGKVPSSVTVTDTNDTSGTTTTATLTPPKGALPRQLANHSAHCIGYGNVTSQREKKLQLHVDDSLITINLCCGNPGFTGTELLFQGYQKLPWSFIAKQQRRMPVSAETNEILTKPVPTRALIHFGAHPHRTLPIETGQRFNWVLWYHRKSSSSVPSVSTEGTSQ